MNGPERATQLLDAGLWLRSSGDHLGAIRLFERALEIDPSNTRARELLASVKAASGVEGAGTPEPLPGVAPRSAAPAPAPNPFQAPPAPAHSGLSGDWSAALDGFPGVGAPQASSGPQAGPNAADIPEFEFEAAGAEAAVPAIPPVPGAASAWDSKSAPSVELELPTGGDAASPLDMLSSFDAQPAPVAPPSAPPGAEPDAPKVSAPPRGDDSEVASYLRAAKERLGLDDHSGAIEFLRQAVTADSNHREARTLLEKSERTLLAMFESKLGDLNAHPKVLLKEDEVLWLNLDHRAGFVLAQIDGTLSFEDVFSVSGMSRFDTARILSQLIDQKVISAGR